MAIAGRDLNLLIPLRALLVEANVTRAGQSVQMGQSSMSTALARLRQHYDDELLVRVGREYELTPLGRMLLPQVQLTVSLVEKAMLGEDRFDPADLVRTFTVMASDFAALELRDAFVAIQRKAPGVRIDMWPLPANPTDSDRDLMNVDFIAAVPGIGVEGRNSVLFVDQYVCIVDPANPALVDGGLSWDAFRALPQVVAYFGKAHVTPAGRRLSELGFQRSARVRTAGFLPIPMVIAGTELVGVVPSRLVDWLGPATGTIGVPLPFGPVEIYETLWWHESNDADRAHAWFREELAAQCRAAGPPGAWAAGGRSPQDAAAAVDHQIDPGDPGRLVGDQE